MPEAISEHINGNSCSTETIEALHDEVDVDDNNEPAPENIPQSTDPMSSPLNTEWVIVDSATGREFPCKTMAQN